MSDALDTHANKRELRAKEQSSQESSQELLRNVHNRVMMDGSEDFNALQYLQGIAANLYSLGLGPESTNVVVEADADAHLLVDCKPNQRIVVFDILLSINAASVISFEDSDGNDILARMYAPNAGQGFTMNSVRGKPLPRNTGLFVQSSNAVSYSVDCSYAIIEDVG